MSKHIAPSTSCNLGCTYCYEEPDREIRGADMTHEYDMDKIMARLEQWNQENPNATPGLHGGEPMLMRDDDIETLFRWIHDNYDGDGGHIQTNATLIKEKHIDMFDRYNVSVGISCDGPPELNAERKAQQGGDDVTESMSVLTGRAITKLAASNVSVGLIVVLSEMNAGTDAKLEKLLSWMDNLNRMGVHGHYNAAIPYEDIQTDISLGPARVKEVYLRTWEWMQEPGQTHREWNPMKTYQDNLLALGLGNCVNNKCDVANAGAAEIVKGDGELTGCGKTWSMYGDGVPFLQGESSGNEYDDSEERYEMLKQVPGPHTEGEPDMGGCKGCRYWTVCQGGCPSAGLDDDYRNRTIWCEAKYALYERIENDMRRMMPQLRLITDLPWDVETTDMQKTYQLDIKPFANMRHDLAHRPSVHRRTNHSAGTPTETVPDDLIPSSEWERQVHDAKQQYDDDNLFADRETGTIHADSSEGWERVDETPAPETDGETGGTDE